MPETDTRDALRDALEAIGLLARSNVQVSIGVGLIASDIAYKVAVRPTLRRAIGMAA